MTDELKEVVSYDFDLNKYLNRINYLLDKVDISITTLKELHRQHVFNIPFENIDIHLGKTISIEEKDIFNKIVTEHRGGYCFEMNGLFTMVLKKIGFQFVNLAARVVLTSKYLARTHMVTIVQLNGTKWLCDVGFGSFGLIEPIPLECNVTYEQYSYKYQLIFDSLRNLYIFQYLFKDHWQDCYTFTMEPFYWNYDYYPMNWYCCTSPVTWFTHTIVCALKKPTCKFILYDDTLKIKHLDGTKTVEKFTDKLKYIEMLEKCFEIVIPKDSQFKNLFKD